MNKLVLVTALAASSFAPAAAFPCGNSVFLETDDATRLVAKMERAFKRGDYKKVRRMAEEGEMDVENQHLADKMSKMVAIAQIRTGAAHEGVPVLRRLLGKRSDPYLKTRLAEGLALSAKTQAEALEILAELEKADLVSDAEGYRTLAELRAANNDVAGRDAALARCRLMAKNKKICAIEAPAKQPPADLKNDVKA